MGFLKWLGFGLIVLATGVYLANASWLAPPGDGRPLLVAHRGLGQPFDRTGLTGQTCTAKRWVPTTHDYLENTLEGIEAAFELGADVVEFDVHRTADDHFVVFHDWTLDCRTEAGGRTRDHRLADLQKLDVGYGYTADGGKTFPFRGRGVGLMPSLDQVLEAFPGRDFLIDVKGGGAEDGRLLARRLARDDGRIIRVYGSPKVLETLEAERPDLSTLSRPRLKQCLIRYAAFGWTGYVPMACRNTLVTVPRNVAPWLWGWPRRLNERLDGAGSKLVLLGVYDGSGHSSGLDDPAALPEIQANDLGGVWTDRIDRIAPALGR